MRTRLKLSYRYLLNRQGTSLCGLFGKWSNIQPVQCKIKTIITIIMMMALLMEMVMRITLSLMNTLQLPSL